MCESVCVARLHDYLCFHCLPSKPRWNCVSISKAGMACGSVSWPAEKMGLKQPLHVRERLRGAMRGAFSLCSPQQGHFGKRMLVFEEMKMEKHTVTKSNTWGYPLCRPLGKKGAAESSFESDLCG